MEVTTKSSFQFRFSPIKNTLLLCVGLMVAFYRDVSTANVYISVWIPKPSPRNSLLFRRPRLTIQFQIFAFRFSTRFPSLETRLYPLTVDTHSLPSLSMQMFTRLLRPSSNSTVRTSLIGTTGLSVIVFPPLLDSGVFQFLAIDIKCSAPCR